MEATRREQSSPTYDGRTRTTRRRGRRARGHAASSRAGRSASARAPHVPGRAEARAVDAVAAAAARPRAAAVAADGHGKPHAEYARRAAGGGRGHSACCNGAVPARAATAVRARVRRGAARVVRRGGRIDRGALAAPRPSPHPPEQPGARSCRRAIPEAEARAVDAPAAALSPQPSTEHSRSSSRRRATGSGTCTGGPARPASPPGRTRRRSGRPASRPQVQRRARVGGGGADGDALAVAGAVGVGQPASEQSAPAHPRSHAHVPLLVHAAARADAAVGGGARSARRAGRRSWRAEARAVAADAPAVAVGGARRRRAVDPVHPPGTRTSHWRGTRRDPSRASRPRAEARALRPRTMRRLSRSRRRSRAVALAVARAVAARAPARGPRPVRWAAAVAIDAEPNSRAGDRGGRGAVEVGAGDDCAKAAPNGGGGDGRSGGAQLGGARVARVASVAHALCAVHRALAVAVAAAVEPFARVAGEARIAVAALGERRVGAMEGAVMCGDGARFARPTRCAEAHPIIAQAVRTAAVEARANRAVGGSVPRRKRTGPRSRGCHGSSTGAFARRGLGAPAEEAGGLPAEDEQDDPIRIFRGSRFSGCGGPRIWRDW